MTNTPQQPELFGDAVCLTRLVPDSPAEQDRFGPHHDVARAMTAMVRSEEGGHSIGLAGRWGAGKSTVIRLFSRDLAVSPNHKVWVFDAWAHEGDPLRRTFLESLIDFLSDEKWVDKKRWAKRVAALAGRRKESSQHTSPRLSPVGRVLALSALMVPLGTALFSHGLKAGVTLSPSAGPVNWTFIFGVLVALSPLWVVGVAALRKRNEYMRAVEAGHCPEKPDYNEVFAVFVQKALTETKTETLETPEPTSIEFERIFADLMTEALSKPMRRLVLVVDNLDRIEPEDALKIWSTLQTFLQHRTHRQHWLPQLWVVMPFDADAIKRLWKREPTNEGGLAASFLDKSFQILFDVPAPLVSDWREYLLTTLRHAFPTHTDEEFHIIYRLIAVHREPGRPPTPRDLKIIVNQIGALHRQRQHTVPLVHMAYYVMLRRAHKDVVGLLRANALPGESEAGLVGDGVHDSLAALAFGVAPDKARQFLLEPPIVGALSSGDAEGLATVKDFIGFNEVLEDAVRQACADWSNAEGGKLFHAVSALVDAGMFDTGTAFRSAGLQRELVRTAKRMESLMPLTPLSTRGLVLLAERTRDPELTRSLFDLYANAVGSLELPPDESSAAAFASEVLPVVTGLENAGLELEETSGIPVPGTIDAYVNVYRALATEQFTGSDAALRVFRPATFDDKFVTRFEQFIRQGQFRAEHRRALQSAIAHSPELSWSPVLSAARERLGGGNSVEPAELIPVLSVLTDHRSLALAEQSLRALVTEGSIAHHVHAVSRQRDMEALAMCVFAHLLVTPSFAPNGQVGNWSAGNAKLREYFSNPPEGLPEELGGLLYDEGQETLLLSLLDSTPEAQALVAETLGVLVSREKLEAFFTPAMVYERWPIFEGYIDPGPLLDRANDNTSVIALAQEDGFLHNRATLYSALVRRLPDGLAFRSWCADGLRDTSSDEWLTQVQDAGPLLQLGLICQQQGEALGLKEPFRRAVQQFAGQLARSECAPPDVEAWSAVFDLLAPDQRNLMLDQVYDVLQTHSHVAGTAFFEVFGPELTAGHHLGGDKSAFTKVLEPFLNHRNVDGLRWVLGQLGPGDSILTSATLSNKRVFRQRLAEELRDGADDDAHEVVKEIAAALGVRPAKAKASTQDDPAEG